MTPNAWGLVVAAGAGLAVSPLLASWTAALAAGDRAGLVAASAGQHRPGGRRLPQ